MPYLRKKYRNGQSRAKKPAGAKSARRRTTKKNYAAITDQYEYPATPKRDPRGNVRHARFLIPEHVKLARYLAADRAEKAAA